MTRRSEARTRYYCREEATRLGWNTQHPRKGGQFLEEQEVVDYFPELKDALDLKRPDFVVVQQNEPVMVIETKNEFEKIQEALDGAKDYAERIRAIYPIRVIVGIAGTPDTAVQVRVLYRGDSGWISLTSHGYQLTQIPIPEEFATALQNNNGTTDVRLPTEEEFYEAAIAISRMLRTAKIEEPVRPKVVGAIILALYQGDFSMDHEVVLDHINSNVKAAIRACDDVPPERSAFLAETLQLSTESTLLPISIRQVVLQLERLNVRSIMRSSVDFLGQFYEAFLRYGSSSKQLGIVFTPRHITRYCAELINVKLGMSVYDPACGTGGFLVAAYDRMMADATSPQAVKIVKESLYGFDTDSTVWALAILNMIFRGDGKSNIVFDSCFDHAIDMKSSFDRVLLNPPFSQDDEPERDFIDHALNSLKPGGELAVVVPTGVLVDKNHKQWRKNLIANHAVLATISMPTELFYPTGSPTLLLVVKAHAPRLDVGTFMAKVHKDGYTISKNRRIPTTGSQLPEVAELLERYRRGEFTETIPGLACVVDRTYVEDGQELCAERWLHQPNMSEEDFINSIDIALRQMYLTVVNYPNIVDMLIEDFTELLDSIEPPDYQKPTARTTIDTIFEVSAANSIGMTNYPMGSTPYISSGEYFNSVVGFIDPPPNEVHDTPLITVTAFGQAHIQPWRFCARGNGGSAVRVLEPRFPMSVSEMLWYASQINSQKWRFHYGRMAIISRLKNLEVDPYPGYATEKLDIAGRIRTFSKEMSKLLPGREC